ncbi:MAG: hypothetical protein P4M11_15280 [Candidatus Pacebacteria bacterium]|nr:hypothetical protein [Candidatus Paceibacterota bacterium]
MYENHALKKFYTFISKMSPVPRQSVYQEMYVTGQPITLDNYLFPYNSDVRNPVGISEKYAKLKDTGLISHVLLAYCREEHLAPNIK